MQVFTKNKSCQASIVFDLFLIGPTHVASQVVLVVKKLPANSGDIRDVGSIPGSGRSPGGGHGNPLQYFAWRVSWTEEPGRLQSMGLQRVGHS